MLTNGSAAEAQRYTPSTGQPDGSVIEISKDKQDDSDPTGTKTTSGEVTANVFAVTGTVLFRCKRIQILFSYVAQQNNAKQTVSLELKGLDKDSMRLSNILSLFRATAEDITYEKPPDSPAFWDLEITTLKCAVEIVPAQESVSSGSTIISTNQEANGAVLGTQKSKRKIILSLFELRAQTSGRFRILDQPSLELDFLLLDLNYQKEKGLRASLLGRFTIAGQAIDVAFLRNKKGEAIFAGQYGSKAGMTSGPSNDSNKSNIQLSDVTNKFLDASADFKYPEEPKVPTQVGIRYIQFIFSYKKVVQILAYGTDLWNVQNAGINFKMDELGGFLRVDMNDQQKYKYTIHLRGQVSFSSFTKVQATLEINPKSNKVLVAKLTKTTGADSDLQSLGEDICPGTKQQWSALVPKTNTLFVADTSLLFADFTDTRYILAGKIANVGPGVLLSRKDPKTPNKRAFFFSVAAPNLESIWGQAQTSTDDVSSSFSINRIAFQVLTYETTLAQLRSDLTAAVDKSKEQLADSQRVVDMEEEQAGASDKNICRSTANDRLIGCYNK